jgi:diguanylate cyclase (GGDEF)-like protein/PAS domain S-box-containing protein
MSVRPLRSIKTRVTLCAVAVLIGSIALTTLVLVREAERDTLAVQRDRELREGVRTASILSRRVVELQRALANTAELLDPATLADEPSLTAFIETKPVLRGLFSNVFAAGPDGRMLVLAEPAGVRHPQLNIANRDYFRSTVSEQRAIVSEPLPGRLSNEPVVIFTTPLRNQSGIYGVIGGALRLASRDLLDDLIDQPDNESDVLVVVTDTRGRILAHPNRTRIMQSIATEPRIADGYANWLAAGGASGGAVEPSGLFLSQRGQVLTVAGVAGPDWLVWRAIPESALLEPLHAARQKAMTWALVIVAGASLLILAVIGWLLRPLTQLKHRAQHLFDAGDDIHAGWPEVEGEIGELSRVLRHVGAERAQLEKFNQGVLAKLGSVMAAAPLGILFTRAQQFELVSAEFCRLVGKTEQELLGRHARTIFASNEDYDALGPKVAAAFASGQPYQGEWRFLRSEVGSFWGQLRGMPVESGNPEAGTIWTLADVSEHVSAREELEWSASHDPLTGLGNRKLFEQQVARTMEARPASLPAAVVMIDLDRFKPINDTAGHAAGDAMLKLVASAITSRVRSTDLAARLGGDEFALLLQNCPPEAALRIAESVREAISGAVLTWSGQQLKVGASMGIAPLAASTDSGAMWLQEADAACYAAKAAGRGVVRTASGHPLRVVAGGRPAE